MPLEWRLLSIPSLDADVSIVEKSQARFDLREHSCALRDVAGRASAFAAARTVGESNAHGHSESGASGPAF